MRLFDRFCKRRIERIVLRDIQAGDILLFHLDLQRIPQPGAVRIYEWLRKTIPPDVKVLIVPTETSIDILRPTVTG